MPHGKRAGSTGGRRWARIGRNCPPLLNFFGCRFACCWFKLVVCWRANCLFVGASWLLVGWQVGCLLARKLLGYS